MQLLRNTFPLPLITFLILSRALEFAIMNLPFGPQTVIAQSREPTSRAVFNATAEFPTFFRTFFCFEDIHYSLPGTANPQIIATLDRAS